jgi:hypothetical protein
MPTGAEVALVAAAAGGAYLLAKSEREELGGLPVGTDVQAPTTPIGERRPAANMFFGDASIIYGATAGSGVVNGGPAATVMSDAELRAAIENIKAEWEKLTEEARCAGMEKLKASLAGTPQAGALDGIDCRNARFEDVTAALVSEAAGQACAKYPKTAALAPLCAAIGQVAGKVLGKALEEVWEEASQAVKNAAEDAWDYATFW